MGVLLGRAVAVTVGRSVLVGRFVRVGVLVARNTVVLVGVGLCAGNGGAAVRFVGSGVHAGMLGA